MYLTNQTRTSFRGGQIPSCYFITSLATMSAQWAFPERTDSCIYLASSYQLSLPWMQHRMHTAPSKILEQWVALNSHTLVWISCMGQYSKSAATTDLAYGIYWENRMLPREKKKTSLKWTAFSEGALNFIFKRSLPCARKHYKKDWNLSSVSLQLSFGEKNRDWEISWAEIGRWLMN